MQKLSKLNKQESINQMQKLSKLNKQESVNQMQKLFALTPFEGHSLEHSMKQSTTALICIQRTLLTHFTLIWDFHLNKTSEKSLPPPPSVFNVKTQLNKMAKIWILAMVQNTNTEIARPANLKGSRLACKSLKEAVSQDFWIVFINRTHPHRLTDSNGFANNFWRRLY